MLNFFESFSFVFEKPLLPFFYYLTVSDMLFLVLLNHNLFVNVNNFVDGNIALWLIKTYLSSDFLLINSIFALFYSEYIVIKSLLTLICLVMRAWLCFDVLIFCLSHIFKPLTSFFYNLIIESSVKNLEKHMTVFEKILAYLLQIVA